MDVGVVRRGTVDEKILAVGDAVAGRASIRADAGDQRAFLDHGEGGRRRGGGGVVGDSEAEGPGAGGGRREHQGAQEVSHGAAEAAAIGGRIGIQLDQEIMAVGAVSGVIYDAYVLPRLPGRSHEDVRSGVGSAAGGITRIGRASAEIEVAVERIEIESAVRRAGSLTDQDAAAVEVGRIAIGDAGIAAGVAGLKIHVFPVADQVMDAIAVEAGDDRGSSCVQQPTVGR